LQFARLTSTARFLPGGLRSHPRGGRTPVPAAFSYVLAVSRRTPVARSIRRSGHPSLPSARICCFFSSLKTLLISTEATAPLVAVNVPSLPGWLCWVYVCFRVEKEGRPDLRSSHSKNRIAESRLTFSEALVGNVLQCLTSLAGAFVVSCLACDLKGESGAADVTTRFQHQAKVERR